jgi:hypothetical protein
MPGMVESSVGVQPTNVRVLREGWSVQEPDELFTGYMPRPDVHIGHDFKEILFSSGDNEFV